MKLNNQEIGTIFFVTTLIFFMFIRLFMNYDSLPKIRGLPTNIDPIFTILISIIVLSISYLLYKGYKEGNL